MGKKRLKLILEFSEFNAQRFNSDNTDVSIGLAPDNTLSVNAFDRHQDDIRVGMSRINTIMRSLSNSSAYRNLKSKLTFEEQQPTSLTILRITPTNNDYYVYLTFVIQNKEYNGVIKNILSRNPTFTSPDVFNDNELTQLPEWQIRLKGLLINSFRKFLEVEQGKYKSLQDKVTAFNIKTGSIVEIRKDDIIEVLRSVPNENKIVIRYNDDFYNLINNSYIYFNYWFIILNI
jgi:hypothetical protein